MNSTDNAAPEPHEQKKTLPPVAKKKPLSGYGSPAGGYGAGAFVYVETPLNTGDNQ